jgi:hypothetical protein
MGFCNWKCEEVVDSCKVEIIKKFITLLWVILDIFCAIHHHLIKSFIDLIYFQNISEKRNFGSFVIDPNWEFEVFLA